MTGRCGTGARTRSRYVVESNLDGGRECPPLDDGEVSGEVVSQVVKICFQV